MGVDLELTFADPELKQAGVDVDQGGTPKTREHFRRDRVMEIEQEIGAPEHRLGLVLGDADPFDRRVCSVADLVQEDPLAESEARHALAERREGVRVAVGILATAQLLEPVDVTPQAA